MRRVTFIYIIVLITSFALFIGMHIENSFPFGTTINTAHRNDKSTPDKKHNDNVITIPAKLGVVTETYRGASRYPIICIRDRHIDPTAQKNIAGIIENLNRTSGIDLVCVEGASQKLDTAYFQTFPDSNIKNKVADYFVDNGLFSGTEFYTVTHRNNRITFIGVEDRKLYKDNISTYTINHDIQPKLITFFKQIHAQMNILKTMVYSDTLRNFDHLRIAYMQNKIKLDEYIENLYSYAHDLNIDLTRYKNITMFRALNDKLKNISPNRLHTDVLKLSVAIGHPELSVDANMSDDNYTDLFDQYLSALAYKTELTRFSDLITYIEYISERERIQTSDLFDEVNDCTFAVQCALLTNQDQFLMVIYDTALHIFDKFLRLKLTPHQYSFMTRYPQAFAVDKMQCYIQRIDDKYDMKTLSRIPTPTNLQEYLETTLSYYHIAHKRDTALVENTLKSIKQYNKTKAVLVAGGFHSDGITNFLRKNNISYTVITPHSDKNTYKQLYSDLMTGIVPDMKSFIDFFTSTLAIPLVTGDMAPKQRVWFVHQAFAFMLGFEYVTDGIKADDPSWKPFTKIEMEQILERMNGILSVKKSLSFADISYLVHEFMIDLRMRNFVTVDDAGKGTLLDTAITVLQNQYGNKGELVAQQLRQLRSDGHVYMVDGLPDGIHGHAGKQGLYLSANHISVDNIIHEALAYSLLADHQTITAIQQAQAIPKDVVLMPVPDRPLNAERDFAVGFGIGQRFSKYEIILVNALVFFSEGNKTEAYAILNESEIVNRISPIIAGKFIALLREYNAVPEDERVDTPLDKAITKSKQFMEYTQKELYQKYFSTKSSSVLMKLKNTGEERLEKLIVQAEKTNRKIRKKSFMTDLTANAADTREVVVLGDLHGDLHGLLKVLFDTGLINHNNVWIGGKNILVQVGDVVDRGKYSLEVFLFLRNLQKQAEEVGGTVVRLLGNHELALLQDNYRMADFTKTLEVKDMLVEDIKNGNIQGAVFIYDHLISHAGITPSVRKWLENQIMKEHHIVRKKVTEKMIADKINYLLYKAVSLNNFDSLLFQVSSLKVTGKSKRSKQGGPFWTDYRDLLKSGTRDLRQIVGHSKGSRIRYTDDMRLINVDVGFYNGFRGFVLLQNGGRKVMAFNLNMDTGRWIKDILIDDITGALKSVGDEDNTEIDNQTKQYWRIMARFVPVTTHKIRNLPILAKFVVDKSLPKSMEAYHLYDDDGSLIIVLRSDVNTSVVAQEAAYHEAWEAFWINHLTQRGNILTKWQRNAIRRRAHILASALQVIAFGSDSITPYHEMQIIGMSQDKRLRLLRENRSAHYAVIENILGDDAKRAVEQYEHKFDYRLLEIELGARNNRRVHEFASNIGLGDDKELIYRLMMAFVYLSNTESMDILNMVSNQLDEDGAFNKLVASIHSSASEQVKSLIKSMLGITERDTPYERIFVYIHNILVTYLTELETAGQIHYSTLSGGTSLIEQSL